MESADSKRNSHLTKKQTSNKNQPPAGKKRSVPLTQKYCEKHEIDINQFSILELKRAELSFELEQQFNNLKTNKNVQNSI